MKFLVLNHNVREHGTWFRAWKVAERLAQLGHDTTFVTTAHNLYRPRRSRKAGVEIWETPSWNFVYGPDGGWLPIGLAWRLGIAAATRWDAVWSFSHKPIDQWPARLAKRLHGAKWIADWCDLWGSGGLNALGGEARRVPASVRRIDAWDERLETSSARDADFVSVISTFLGRETEKLGVPPHRIHLLLNGANFDILRPLDAAKCRRKIGLAPDGVVLGYISNWYPEEDFFLDAMQRVVAARPGTRILVRGPEFRGGAEALRRRGLDKALVRYDRMPFARLAAMVGACDIMLLPMEDTLFNRSRWPHKIGDYLSAGRPMVACEVGDVGPFLARHPVGIGSAPRVDDFANAVVRMIDTPELRREMGARARRLAEETMRWDALVDETLAQFGIKT